MTCPTCHRDNPADAKFCGGCGGSLSASPVISSTSQGMVSFPAAVKLGLQGYSNFDDTATRAEYWWWHLFHFGVVFLVALVEAFIWGPAVLAWLLTIALLMPLFAVRARRLHDIGMSGWWQLLLFVPLLNFVLFIVWGVKKGDKGMNKYGSDPRQPTSQQPYKP